jgi:hypothetical protein
MKVVFNTALELWGEYERTIVENRKSSFLLDHVKENVGFQIPTFHIL